MKMGGLQENLHSSLLVPSVQLLAAQQLESVPSRYVRDQTIISPFQFDFDNNSPPEPVPLIDMSKLLNPHSQPLELQNLHSACRQWGLFQLINHGVSDESLRNMKKQVDEFFKLPFEEKKLWAQKPGSLQGYGQAFVTSEEQKLDWNDMIFLKALPIQNRKLEFWPDNPPKFRETLQNYSEDIRQLVVSITKSMAAALELNDEYKEFYECYQEGTFDVRLNCYPPCPEPERVIGMVPHADMSGITLLLDGGDVPGLQVLKDGNWVFVEPIDGAIVVNIGQIIEIMSNGIYKAPDHRAVVNKSRERLSVVTFCYPNPYVNIGPSKGLLQSGNRPLYKTVTLEEYFQSFYNRKLEVSFIDSLKI
ncbi:protein SRG1-like [Euphorbia lathyris]|uniref:protein SRG1-like n=1 Tax=Euphorbia lathyris TaxID=212925 RepID=UPI00331326CC